MDPSDAELGVDEDNWWFIGKRALMRRLFRLCGKNLRILDVGCGMGEDVPLMLEFGKVTAIDMSPKAIASVRSRFPEVDTVTGRIEAWKPKKQRFDVVAAFDILEHIKDDHAAVRAIQRGLRPGGFFIGTVPAFPALWSPHDERERHVRRYTPSGLRELLAGWDIRLFAFWNFTLFPPLLVLRTVQRWTRSDAGVAWKNENPVVNGLLAALLRAEAWCTSRGLHPPFGVTLAFVAQRPSS